MNLSSLFAKRVSEGGNGEIAEILALAERPDIISFAGGLPDPSAFLMDEVAALIVEIISRKGGSVFQYSPTPGLSQLRDYLTERPESAGAGVSRDNIIVTSGGVEGLRLVCNCLIEPGDTIIVEAPTYLAALHIFRSFQARIEAAAVDDNGLNTDALEELLCRLQDQAVAPKFIYVIPEFQNPSGRTLPLERRRRLVELAEEFGVLIVEDTAYREIRLEGDAVPTLLSLSPDQVIQVNTFSKFFAPGIRLGWNTASHPLLRKLILSKQVSDQCSSTFNQHLALEAGRCGLLIKQTERLIALYRKKRDRMAKALAANFPDGVHWTKPAGGFYFWIEFPEDVDTVSALSRAIRESKVAYVAGPAFYHDRRGRSNLRLCYSLIPESDIDEGIYRLARLFVGQEAGSWR